MRPIHVWITFGFSLIGIIITTLWVNDLVCQLDLAQKKAQERTMVEENVRLALWRIDSYLAPIIAQENSTPYFSYSSFYPLERAYSKMFDTIYAEEFLVPSPLMSINKEDILLYFQLAPNNELSSPQVPEMDMRIAAQNGYTTAKKIDLYYNLLEKLKQKIHRNVLENTISPNKKKTNLEAVENNFEDNFEEFLVEQNENTYKSKPIKKSKKIYSDYSWQEKNESELEVRKQYREHYSSSNSTNRQSYTSNIIPSNVVEGVMKAIWMEDALVLVRRVSIDETDYFQGCWLNWTRLRENLLNNIKDLLPDADLKPIISEGEQQRVLAMLPIQLIPGEVIFERDKALSPTQISLMVAWGCLFLATVAIAILLIGVVSISERRASFVSAVTHELRTPLTTFRMYTEMLHEGMVTNKEKQQKYFHTMLVEAKRLAHLVENVLSYAKLEKKRTKKHLQPLSVKNVVLQMQSHLEQRAQQAKMNLEIQMPENLQDSKIITDSSIVEQIVFNLVDNACKYASKAQHKQISFSIFEQNKFVCFKIKDYGPGLSKKQRQKLFRPFMKSAQEAAHSAPGVGLGLALSKRLAKHIGGKLFLDEQNQEGASFILELPKEILL